MWAGLDASPTVDQLRAYLHEFPKGASVAAAQASITALEKEAAEVRAADQRRMQETTEWGAVAASTDKTAVQAFLKQWPRGQYAGAAKARLRELNQRAAGKFTVFELLAIAWAILLVPVSFGVGILFANNNRLHLWGTGPGNTGATLAILLFIVIGASVAWKRRSHLEKAEKIAYLLGCTLAVIFVPIFFYIK